MNGPVATNQNGQIQKRKEAPATLAQLVQSMVPEIARALPKHITPDRMARIALTALRQNPDLAACNQASFAACLMQCAAIGLEPNTPLGLAYLIPRNSGRQGKECTLQFGYQGLLELARRSGQIMEIDADVVYEGDLFTYRKGDNACLSHEPRGEDDPKKITHAYAVVKLKDGGVQRKVLNRKKILKAKSASASGDRGPWGTHFDEMAIKTALRAVCKLLPRSAELAMAIAIDEAPEVGIAQSRAMDQDVIATVARMGHEVSDEPLPVIEAAAESAVETPHDKATGEVLPASKAHNRDEQDAPPPDDR